MLRKILLLAAWLLSMGASAQTFKFIGKLYDTENQPMIGANVSLLVDGEVKYQAVSDISGIYFFDDVKVGAYRLKISYVGFFNVNKEVQVDKDVVYSDLILYASPVNLDEVVVEGKVPLATLKGDTTSYNASQYKVLADASTEDLVAKLPGISIENGTISAEGETVQQVLVDGKPFFGSDASAALKNLPAEVVSKIEIFDQKSEQAQFTGFDDGETSKTINIVTKMDKRNGQFGKAYAAYGTENHYNLGGNFSLFNGDRRISVIGQANDINIQNFSSEDILGVSGSSGRRRGGRGGGRGGEGNDAFNVAQQPGIATTNAFGVNFSDEWGEKREANFSYFVNQSSNISEEVLSRAFFDRTGDASGEVYDESNLTTTDNINHRFSGRFEYELSKNTSFNFTPSVSYQSNDGFESTSGFTEASDLLLNSTDNNYEAFSKGWNLNNRGLVRHRFGASRRTLSLSLRNQYSSQGASSALSSLSNYFVPVLQSDELDQIAKLDQQGWNNSANLSFTNPIGEKSMLSVEYRIGLESDDADRQTFNKVEQGQYTDLDELLSNVFTNKYVTNSAGLGYNYRVGKFMFVVRTSLQRSQLDTDQTFPYQADLSRTFVNVIPFGMWSYRIDRQNDFRLIYRTNTRKPTLGQLQEVVDNSNPLQLSIGNAELDQQFQHSMFARLKRTNAEKGTVFFALIGGNITQDYIGNSLYTSRSNSKVITSFNLVPGTQLTQNVNLSGYYDFRTYVTYGMPIYALKSNLNLNVSGNFSNTPGLINDELNNAQSKTFGLGVSLSSNISEKIDFLISSRSSYNDVTNDLNDLQNSSFLSQNSSLKLDWILPAHLVFRTSMNNQFYTGLSDGFNESFWIWNLAIGKKIFKNKLGELNISVYDLLNQNLRINREVTGNYIEDVRTNVLQRYIMVNFIYNFRNFGKVPEVQERERGLGPVGRF